MFAVQKLGDGIMFSGVGADEMPKTQAFGDVIGRWDSMEECVRHFQGQGGEYKVNVYRSQGEHILMVVYKNNSNLVFGVYKVTELVLVRG